MARGIAITAGAEMRVLVSHCRQSHCLAPLACSLFNQRKIHITRAHHERYATCIVCVCLSPSVCLCLSVCGWSNHQHSPVVKIQPQ